MSQNIPTKRVTKLFRSSLLSCAILLCVSWSVRAQYQIQSWTTDEGLPQNTVHSLAQTPDGYLWLATLDGLVRFDGVRFTVFNKNNTQGLDTNRFIQIVLDGRGDLWMRTENNSIVRFSNGKFATFSFDHATTYSHVRIGLNKERAPFVIVDERVFTWDGAGFKFLTNLAGENQEKVILWGKDESVWFAEGRNLRRQQGDQTSAYSLPVAGKDTRIIGLLEDSRGRLWIGTNDAGLFVLEREKFFHYTGKNGLPRSVISPSVEDRNGALWASTSNGAVVIRDGKVEVITTAQGLSDNVLASIYEDREGNIWIGSLFRGLNRLRRQSVTFYTKKDGLTANVIRPIYEDREGSIWIGGEDLTRYRDGRFQSVPGRESQRQPKEVTAIEQDRSGRLWFGHWEGVYYFENGRFTDATDTLGLKANVSDIHEDRAGILWFASNRGLFRHWNGATTRINVADGLPGDDVKIIHESDDGTLWIGTYGGLAKLESRQSSAVRISQVFTTKEGLASDLVRSLYEDADGALWIGSYDGGLTRLKDGRFTRYTTRDGLFNDGVFQILEDARANLWMSSNRGIYRVAKAQLNDFADGKISRINSIAYNKADGLLETECNGGQQPAGMKAADGKLWFPTQRGVAVIDTEKITTNPFAPPVLLESATVDGEAVAVNKEIEIQPGKNNLEIVYTGLSFVKPEFIKFRYKLAGLDEDWSEASDRRTAYYSYLPPGEYVFTVIAANSDDVWNTKGASVRIKVIPPFYRTWWFVVSSLFVIGGAAVLFYRRRVTQLNKSRAAQQAFSRQLIESQEQERKRIAAELHDSLGQNLLIIKNRALLGLTGDGEPLKAIEQFDEISATASQALEEVREIAHNLRPYQLDRLGLTKALESVIKRAASSSEIDFTARVAAVDALFSKESEINLYRVVQESVNNILKHSGASAASLIVTREGASVRVEIEDNGVGFDSESVSGADYERRGFGLAGIAERARILGAKYTIRSTRGRGTMLTLNIALPDERRAQLKRDEQE